MFCIQPLAYRLRDSNPGCEGAGFVEARAPISSAHIESKEMP